jgi:carotenoid 1,2-hydratase
MIDLGFTRAVVPDGYAWWYIDALSDDGRHGLTVIAFVGSVFSPYYAWARRRGPTDPTRHCAINVVLSGPRDRWAMTERGSRALTRMPDGIAVGPSSVRWDGTGLTIEIDETSVPVPRRLRGTVRLVPRAVTPGPFILDAAGKHRWWPIAPRSRVEVALRDPSVSWQGEGYFDTNHGDEPLEAAFSDWDWCRTPSGDGAAILYDVRRRDGTDRGIAVRIDGAGTVTPFDAPQRVPLAPARWWRMPRSTRSDPGPPARVTVTMVDAPFYARSVVETRILGAPATAVHESLSLDRFTRPWVQALLPFRMPRMGD